MNTKRMVSAAVIASVLCTGLAFGQVPQLINYQGVLTNASGTAVNGTQSIKFSIYSAAAGGTALWTETQSVSVKSGIFNVLLGSSTAIPFTVFSTANRYLGIKVGIDAEMTPRYRLASTTYSFNSNYFAGKGVASFVQAGQANSVTAAMISPNIVSSVDGVSNDGGNIDLVAGSNVTITPDDAGNKITIAATGGGGVSVPLSLTGNVESPNAVISGKNTGTGEGVYGESCIPNSAGVHGLDAAGTGVYGVGVNGVYGTSLTGSGIGVEGRASTSGIGVKATSTSGIGIKATSTSGTGLHAEGAIGVYGEGTTTGVEAKGHSGYGVKGVSLSSTGVYGYGTTGVEGIGSSGYGVKGVSSNSTGVYGEGQKGVFGKSVSGDGLRGESDTGKGVYGQSRTNMGVHGTSDKGTGVYGASNEGTAIVANSMTGKGIMATGKTAVWANGTSDPKSVGVDGYGKLCGVDAYSDGASSVGVRGRGTASGGVGVAGFGEHMGVYGDGGNYGVYGYCSSSEDHTYAIYGQANSFLPTIYAGYFYGNVCIVGVIIPLSARLRIDHPLDPKNKYLQHSFVESPDMMNIYNGNVVLDSKGEAVVDMPIWFEALNQDFRYQLTALGAPGPNLYVADEISGNRFRIAGGTPGVKVSWQVTGVRHDVYADANRTLVEVEKSDKEKGRYLTPKEWGQPESMGIGFEERQKMNAIQQALPTTKGEQP